MMVWKFGTFILLVCSRTVLTDATSPTLKLFNKDSPDPVVISGSECHYGVTFDADSSHFSCACMTGLWAFYDDTCGAPTVIAGGIEEKCVQLHKKVRKVHLLSPPGGIGEAATIFSSDMKNTKARIETDGPLKSLSFKHFDSVKVVATGTNSWGLKPLGSCLAPEIPDQTLFGSSPQFCTFTHNATVGTLLHSTCDYDVTISPSSCVPFLEASVECPSYPPVSKGRAIAKPSVISPKGKAIVKAPPVVPKGKGIVKSSPVAPKSKAVGKTSPAVPKGKAITKPSHVAPKGKAIVKASHVVPKGKAAVKGTPVAPKGKAAIKGTPIASKSKAAIKGTPVAPKGKAALKGTPVAPKGKAAIKGTPVAAKGKAIVKAASKGRVFLGAVKGLANLINVTDTEPIIELASHDVNMNLKVDMTNPVMNSELWNYLTSRAQSILNLTTGPIEKVHVSPTFKFLELAKQVLQKACPNSYVPDEHFDMALATFTSLQIKQFNYKDTFSDYATGLRIEESLKFCRDNMTTYPFVDSANRTKETCNKTIEMGTFEAFGNFSELVLPSNAASRENEPIVETVWKIFTHAHAACYDHFAEGFNDHHRFTSILMPLFTNEINDIWNSIKGIHKNTYAGLLGDALKLMDGVAYCAEYSRLETPYPWELPRPVKDPNSVGRKRRAAVNKKIKFTCLKNSFENKC